MSALGSISRCESNVHSTESRHAQCKRLCPQLGDLSALEFLDPRSHFYFPRPSTAWLAQHAPIVDGNRIRIEHGVWLVWWLGSHWGARADHGSDVIRDDL